MENKSSGFLNNFTLKMIAVITMVIDHVGYVIFPQVQILRAIGRISFPIFCFLIVEGFFHTRSHLNYLIRLSIFALISEIPFDLAFHQTLFDWQHQNVFITLALGLFAIFCIEEINNRKIYIIPLILIFLIAVCSNCDYGLGGVLLICVFYLTRENAGLRFLLCGLILYVFFNSFELYGLLALIPISLYNGKKGPATRLFFYWFYPAHLLLLFAIKTYLL